jgi:hypothetical protein
MWDREFRDKQKMLVKEIWSRCDSKLMNPKHLGIKLLLELLETQDNRISTTWIVKRKVLMPYGPVFPVQEFCWIQRVDHHDIRDLLYFDHAACCNKCLIQMECILSWHLKPKIRKIPWDLAHWHRQFSFQNTSKRVVLVGSNLHGRFGSATFCTRARKTRECKGSSVFSDVCFVFSLRFAEYGIGRNTTFVVSQLAAVLSDATSGVLCQRGKGFRWYGSLRCNVVKKGWMYSEGRS